MSLIRIPFGSLYAFAEDPSVCGKSPRSRRKEHNANAQIDRRKLVGRAARGDEGVAQNEGVQAHGHQHGTCDAQRGQGYQQTQDPADAATEFGEGGQSLEQAGAGPARSGSIRTPVVPESFKESPAFRLRSRVEFGKFLGYGVPGSGPRNR